MKAYSTLASAYDALMNHVDYGLWLDVIRQHVAHGATVLDLACGTGTLTALLEKEGYDVIGVDISAEMLMQAREKCSENALFLQQSMTKLNLYGTVNACVCSLDGLNYLLCDKDFAAAVGKVRLFLEAGGIFLFDLKKPKALEAMNQNCFVSKSSNSYCIWESTHADDIFIHEVTLFNKRGTMWEKSAERHKQKAFEKDFVVETLLAAGFDKIGIFEQNQFQDRDFFIAEIF